MYRTGDLGAYDADGNLVYHTRKDFQIKQMGQRIELGEIEAAAMALDGVSRAACVYDPAKKKILLFYTGEKEESAVKKELGVNLPPYMMPGKTARMDFLPMNKNGKIDRGALLSMDAGGTDRERAHSGVSPAGAAISAERGTND